MDSAPVIAATEEYGDVVVYLEQKTEMEVNNDQDPTMKIPTELTEEHPQEYMGTQNAGATLGSSIVNMMNTIIGAGILSIPSTVSNAGLIGSFLMLAISLYLSLEGGKMLSAASIYTKEQSYGLIGNKLASKTVGIVGDIAMIIFDLGISVAYFIIMFQQVLDLIKAWTGIAPETVDASKVVICCIVVLVTAFPLLTLPTMDALRFTSAASVFCICLFVVISVVKGVGQLVREPLQYQLLPKSFPAFTSAVSVFFTSMCCHVNIPKMTSELKFPEKTKFANKMQKMNRVNTVAFISCGTIYFVVGAFGYLAYGEAIESNLLTNFSRDKAWYLNIVKLAYAFVVLFSYPALAFAALVTFDLMCFKQPRPMWRRVTEAFIWSLISLIIAIKVPKLDIVFGITGSMCGILLCFAIPAYYYICIAKKEKAKQQTSRIPLFHISQARNYFSWFLFYLGIIAAIIFTAVQAKSAITQLTGK